MEFNRLAASARGCLTSARPRGETQDVANAAAASADRAVHFLLDSTEPAIRYLARRDLLCDQSREDPDVILSGPKVSALLTGQRPREFRPGRGWRSFPMAEFGFGVHPYRNWTGAHWRLISLVELAIPAHEKRARLAAEQVLGWLARPERIGELPAAGGLARRCASQEGNALAVCCRLGLAADERVQLLASSLIGWQWPDGGCSDTGKILTASNSRSPSHWRAIRPGEQRSATVKNGQSNHQVRPFSADFRTG
jgi:hypothetical protein